MAQSRHLTDQQIRQCVFLQSYEKIGSDQFIRMEPKIDITIEGDDLPNRFKDPIVSPSDTRLQGLSQGSIVEVRVFDGNAVERDASQGRFATGDLLRDIDAAQDRCDAALRQAGGVIVEDLSRY